MSRVANNALLGGGVRVWVREQRKIKGRSKALVSLCWQSWTSLLYLGIQTFWAELRHVAWRITLVTKACVSSGNWLVHQTVFHCGLGMRLDGSHKNEWMQTSLSKFCWKDTNDKLLALRPKGDSPESRGLPRHPGFGTGVRGTENHTNWM